MFKQFFFAMEFHTGLSYYNFIILMSFISYMPVFVFVVFFSLCFIFSLVYERFIYFIYLFKESVWIYLLLLVFYLISSSLIPLFIFINYPFQLYFSLLES